MSLITLTFYFPFWLRKTSRLVNGLLPTNQISTWFFPASILLTILNFGMVIPEIVTDDNPIVMMVSKLMNNIDCIVILVWAFKLRNRINLVLEAEEKTDLWFNALWTFLFQMFYIQFRINKIKAAEPIVGGDRVNPPPQR